MSSSVNYDVTIDSQYRDFTKYPYPTTFEVTSKVKDPYATYPDGTFYYPWIRQQYENTGAYNPPHLNPGVFAATGSGIAYPSGDPYDSTQVFPRVSVSPNLADINLPIQVKGGSIIQMFETDADVNGEYFVYFCGLRTPNISQAYTPFGIEVDGYTFYQLGITGSNTGYTQAAVTTPYFCCIKLIRNRAKFLFVPIQLVIMDEYNSTVPITQNSTTYVDLHLSGSNVYTVFDFTTPAFKLAIVTPEDIYLSPYFGVSPSLIKPFLNPTFTKEWTGQPALSQQVTNAIMIGFDSTLNNFAYYNNAPWGYHQWYTYPDAVDVKPSFDGANQLTVDDAGNFYAAIHTDSTSINFSEATIPAPYIPLVSNNGREFVLSNSDPLAGVIPQLDGVRKFTNVVLCNTSGTTIGPPFATYSVYAAINNVPTVNNDPTSVVMQQFTGVYGTNSAVFFNGRTGTNTYIAMNSSALPTGTDSLQVWHVDPVANTLAFQSSALPIALTGDRNHAVSATNLPTNEPDFNFNPAVVALYESSASPGQVTLNIYEYTIGTNTLNFRARFSNAGAGELAYNVTVWEQPANAPITRRVYAALVTYNNVLKVYGYNSGSFTFSLISSVTIPSASVSTNVRGGACSSIFSFVNANISYVGVVSDQRTYLFSRSDNFTQYQVFENNATFNLFVQSLTDTSNRNYLVGSNVETSVASIYNVTVPTNIYQVGGTFQEGPSNLWYASVLGEIFGFSRDEYIAGNNKIYSSQSTIFVNAIALNQYLVSQHNYYVNTNSTPVNFDLPNYCIWIAPSTSFEDNLLVLFSDSGAMKIVDMNQFPIFTTFETSTFQSSSYFNILSLVKFSLTLYVICASNATRTYWKYGTTLTSLSAVQMVNGSLSWITPSQQIVVYNQVGLDSVISLYNYTSTSVVSSITLLNTTTLYGNVVTFTLNDANILVLVTQNASNVYQVLFINVDTFTQLATTIDIPYSSGPTTYPVRTSYVTNPVDGSIKYFVQIQTAFGNSRIFTVLLSGDSNQLSSFAVFPSVSGTNPFDASVELSDLQLYGQSLGATYDNATSQQLFSLIQTQSTGAPQNLAIYDVSSASSFTRIAEISTPFVNGIDNREGQGIWSVNTSANSNIYPFNLVTTSKTYLFTNNGAGSGGSIADTITIYDITNPNVFGQVLNTYGSSVTEAVTGSTGTSSVVKAQVNILGKGTAVIHKITPNGTPSWFTSLGDIRTIAGDSANYDSQNINVTGLQIDSSELYLYASVDWQTKIGVTPQALNTGTQLILRSDFPELYNSSVIKFNVSNGYSNWLVPLEGSSNVTSVDVSLSPSGSVVIANNIAGFNMLIYDQQPFGSLVTPIGLQYSFNIGDTNNCGVSMFNGDGDWQWSSPQISYGVGSYINITAMGWDQGNLYFVGGFNTNKVGFANTNDEVVQYFYGTNYTTDDSLVTYPYTYCAKYDFSGNYKESNVTNTVDASLTSSWVSVNTNNNRAVTCTNALQYNTGTTVYVRNKDGTLGVTDEISPNFRVYTGATGATSYILSGNSVTSYNTRYDINTDVSTQNKLVSEIRVYKDVVSTGPSQLFAPYQTGAVDLFGYYMYLPENNTNYFVNSSTYTNSVVRSTNNVDVYDPAFTLLLNEVVDTSVLPRILPAFTVSPSIQPLEWAQFQRYDSQYFYIANISTGETYAVLSFRNFGAGSPPAPILGFDNIYMTTVPPAYLITANLQNKVIAPITRTVPTTAPGGNYYDVNNLANVPTAFPSWGWIAQFNANALYYLPFYPAALDQVEYYTVRLVNLVVPNRAIVQDPDVPSGKRYLSDYRYFYLQIYNTDDNGTPSPEIANNLFNNNPNFSNLTLFQCMTTPTSGNTNYVSYFSSATPRLKFTPGFYNIRTALYNPNGNLIVFDNSPDSNNPEDAVFTNLIQPSFNNITVELSLTKLVITSTQ